ncbi:MAG: prepilin-type N-terminal cleavage/methylation domain-containing protein [Planctomycetota bacterium]|nr:prepilin-type N-terminal cleavage/methylation domain-containing protein [Planctomycetota bacterium]
MKRRAFSLTELLVVITILVILIAIAVPAFRSLLGNSERSLAENQLRVGLSAARDAAIRSDGGDAAAVFFFTGGRVRIIACVQVGTLCDAGPTTPCTNTDVFAPLGTIEPVQLPVGWSVRGYAPPGSIGQVGEAHAWYESFSGLSNEGTWVFPETDFVSLDGTNVETRGVQRHTFFVRFRAGDGALDTSNRRSILVLDPVRTESFRGAAPYAVARADQATDLAQFAKRTLALLGQPAAGASGDARALFGDESVDTILARPVTELSLHEEGRLIAAVGARPNRVTGTLYAPPDENAQYALYDATVLPAGVDQDETQRRVGAWIEGRLDIGAGLVGTDARVFMVQRYLGNMQEISP